MKIIDSDIFSVLETPSPLRNCSDEDNELTIRATTGVDPMINSIIFQPRSFFEFKEKEKDVMMELSPATDENLDMLRKEGYYIPVLFLYYSFSMLDGR